MMSAAEFAAASMAPPPEDDSPNALANAAFEAQGEAQRQGGEGGAETQPSTEGAAVGEGPSHEALLHNPQGVTWEDALRASPIASELIYGIQLMNYSTPSTVQATVLPALLERTENVIAQSQSGTGKTACFGLATLSLVDLTQKFPQALIMTPTRELAKQVKDEMLKMAKGLGSGVRIVACIPGYDFSSGISAQIVVGTPGRVKSAVDQKFLGLSTLLLFVLDEADVMLEESTSSNSSGVHGSAAVCLGLRKQLAEHTRVFLFSATFPEKVRKFAQKMAPNSVKFTLHGRNLALPYINQLAVMLNNEEEKFQYLMEVYRLCDINQSIIFVNTRDVSKRLTERMREMGFSISLIMSEMTGEERDEVVQQFRRQESRVLIATNVIARGLDVPQTSIVINYQVPVDQNRKPDGETYLHRIGRTGRFGRPGVAINLLMSDQDALKLQEINSTFETEVKMIAPTADALKDIVGESIQ